MSGKDISTPFLPTTPSSLSRTLERLLELTRSPSRALDSRAPVVASRTTEKQGHHKVCCDRRGGPRPPSRTADINLNFGLAEHTLFHTDPWLWKVIRLELSSKWLDPLLIRSSWLKQSSTNQSSSAAYQVRWPQKHLLFFLEMNQFQWGCLATFPAIACYKVAGSWNWALFALKLGRFCPKG